MNDELTTTDPLAAVAPDRRLVLRGILAGTAVAIPVVTSVVLGAGPAVAAPNLSGQTTRKPNQTTAATTAPVTTDSATTQGPTTTSGAATTAGTTSSPTTTAAVTTEPAQPTTPTEPTLPPEPTASTRATEEPVQTTQGT